MTGRVNIAVALSCEARPLIDYYRLQRIDQVAGYGIFQNSDGISLIVTGIGKSAMASACGYLAGRQANPNGDQAAWLNVGIAGHKSVSVGELLRIGRIVDRSTGNTYYPSMILDTPCATSTLYSVDHPESEFGEDAAYDMEASAFFDSTSRFVSAELIQVLKLVSDTPVQPAEQISKERIQQWINAKLELITNIIGQLQNHSAAYNTLYGLPDECLAIQDAVRCSVSQKAHFNSLYRRYHALGGTNLAEKLRVTPNDSAKNVLATFGMLVDTL